MTSTDNERQLLALNADLERRVADLTAEAAAQAVANSAFLAHLTHEIRTPLNAMLGLTQVLEQGALTPDQRNMAREVRTAGRSLVLILNDILDLSRIESGGLQLEQRPFALAPLMAEVEALLGATGQSHGLTLKVEAPPALTGALMGDPRRIEQAMVSLVGNAIRFTDEGRIQVRVVILERSERVARLRFEVNDTGIGVAPEVLTSMLTPFSDVESVTSRRFGGTGLGLSLCRRLVELMGGRIGIEALEGEGATFWFELTLARLSASEALAGLLPAGPVTTGARLLGLRLLVVDDDPMSLEVVERLVALEGGGSVLAANGQQALDQLRAQPQGFDAVLMDVQMPVLDGLSTTRAIRETLGLTGLPVIAVTAGLLPAEQERARAAGANDLLPKPVELEQLVAVLTRWADPRVLAAATRLGPGKTQFRQCPEDLPTIPGIDPARAALLAQGSTAFFRRLLRAFFADANGMTQLIQAELAAGALDSAADRLHRLQGAAANLGALGLAQSARQLEGAIRFGPGDQGAITDLSAQFTRRLENLLRVVAPWLREVPVQRPDPDPAAAGADTKLAALRNALSFNEPRPARQLFAELEASLVQTHGEAPVRQLALALDSLRFEEALEILDGAGHGQPGP